MFEKTSHYHGIYRDYGIIFFKDDWIDKDVQRWLEVFQLKINEICESEDIVFTCEIWRHQEMTGRKKRWKKTLKKRKNQGSSIKRILFPRHENELE